MISDRIFQKLNEVIPGGVNSGARAMQNTGLAPIIADRGQGDTLYDADGRAYIDYCGSWGPLIHGHCHPEIVQAVQEQVARGSTFGLSTALEERLARSIVEKVSSIEKVRCVSSGTEATMSAIRLARGFTGREKVIKFSGHYHGHADYFLVNAGSGVTQLPSSSSAGVSNQAIASTICLPFNDIASARRALQEHEVAAVIVEPMAGNMGVVPPVEGFLECLREETRKQDALLIFDEVITGFRVAKGGAQERYGVLPDLTCLGKIIGGGYPVGAFGGRRDIMDSLAPLGRVYQAGTLSGNPIAMTAGIVALDLLNRQGFYQELEAKTRIITEPVSEVMRQQGGCLQQVGSAFTLFFGIPQVANLDDARRADSDRFFAFLRAMVESGIFLPPSPFEACFVSSAHSVEHLEYTRDTMLEFLQRA